MFVLGSLATPVALLEEYVARPIANIPFTIHNAGIGIGQHAARAYLWQEQGETGEAVVESLRAVTSFSTGFVAGASVAVPVAGALESRATQLATSETAVLTAEANASRTPLYRAVQQGELADIQATNAFRNPVGIEVKYFSTTPEGAASYARQAFRAWPQEGPYTLVTTDISTELISNEMTCVVDRGVSTVVVPDALLPGLNPPVVQPFFPIP
jgi:hypothetical protein